MLDELILASKESMGEVFIVAVRLLSLLSQGGF
jgi:hypothetical protein